MKTRRFAMIVALSAAAVCVTLLIAESMGAGDPEPAESVELRGGRTLRGRVMEIAPARLLVQTDEDCLMLPIDMIERIGGRPVGGGRHEPRVLLSMETMEEIDGEGRIHVRSRVKVEAPESRTVHRVDWGIAPHEIGLLDDYAVLDAFGRVLPIEVRDEGAEGRKRVFVDLTRPVLPGENAEVVVSYAGLPVLREGREWIYRHEGDYPDDRLVSRAVLLPRGAVIRHVSPEPSYRDDEADRPLVIWRRYFPAGDRSPWEIRFTVG